MDPFVRHTGVVVPINKVNVDTDQIIPKQFLKRVERTGFGEFLFFDWRYLNDGSPNPDFELNRPGYTNATILVGGRNFGCGSSREHAPWALQQYGIKVIIAPSFADIFYSNSAKNGLLLVTLPEETVLELLAKAAAQPGYQLTVDLEKQLVTAADGFSAAFKMEPFLRECLLHGWDDIGLTMRHEPDITAYEAKRRAWQLVGTSAS